MSAGDRFYDSVLVYSVIDCEWHCLLTDGCDMVESKVGNVGTLCLLFHSEDVILADQTDGVLTVKICPSGEF